MGLKYWEHVALVYAPPDLMKRGIMCSDSSSMTKLGVKLLIPEKLEEPLGTSFEKIPQLTCV